MPYVSEQKCKDTNRMCVLRELGVCLEGGGGADLRLGDKASLFRLHCSHNFHCSSWMNVDASCGKLWD